MDLDAILAELTKHPLADLMAKLPKGAGTLYQAIFDKGHDVMRAKATADETRLKAELDAAITARDEALDKAKKSGGNDATLKQVREEHERTIEDLKAQHKRALKEMGDTVARERVDLAAEEFHSSLLAAGVEPDYAAVQKDKHKSRFRFAKDGALEIVQEGKEIPFAASSRKEAITMLVDEVKKATPPKFMVSTVTGGSGANEAEALNGGGKGNDKAFYDSIRTKAEEQRKGTEKSPTRTLADAFPVVKR